MGRKFQFLKKVFSTIFFHLQNMFHNICYHTKRVSQLLILIKSEIALKIFQNFGPHFPKNFTSYCPPMGPKFQFLKKVFPTNFFTHKTCSTFHIGLDQNMDKNLFDLIFQNILQVLVAFRARNFNF